MDALIRYTKRRLIRWLKVKVKVRDSGCKHILFRPFSIVGPLQFSITNDWTLLRDITWRTTHTQNPSHFRLCQARGAKAANTIFKVFSITRLGIKPQSTGYQVDALNRYTKPKGKGTGQRVQAHIVRPFSIVGPLQFSITNDWTLLRDITWRTTHTQNPSHFRLCRAPGAKAANTIFKVFSMTRLGIKPQSTDYQVDALNRYTKRRLSRNLFALGALD